MKVITDKDLYQRIWNKIYSDCSFHPSTGSHGKWLKPKGIFRTYKLGKIWNEEQEAVINFILCEVIGIMIVSSLIQTREYRPDMNTMMTRETAMCIFPNIIRTGTIISLFQRIGR